MTGDAIAIRAQDQRHCRDSPVACYPVLLRPYSAPIFQSTKHSMSQTTPQDAPPSVNDDTEAEVEPVPAADPLAEAQADAEKWKDVALRSAAELDNFRKRTTRDIQDARSYANADLLRSLIPILDNFEMGLEAARSESEKSMIYQGLSMVRRQLTDFLREQNVEEINAQGQKFDPNLHEAMSQEPSAEYAEGIVVKVMRRGFKLKDRLLRAALVIISSGPATPGA